MLYSMTAFARHTSEQSWGTLTCEISSLNHRYLEAFFKLPEELRGFEAQLRERLTKQLRRGKVDIQLKYRSLEAGRNALGVNNQLLQDLAQVAQHVRTQFDQPLHISFTELLAWPGMLQGNDVVEQTLLQQAALSLFDETLEELVNVRAREGHALQLFLEAHLTHILEQVEQVQHRLPQVSAALRDKLLTRIASLNIAADPTRLEQELALLAQKMDVTEEIERLQVHVNETRKTLHTGGAVGRRLDFLMQEFNREANTLASKSMDSEVTLAAVNLKVLIEQMREQVQNIE